MAARLQTWFARQSLTVKLMVAVPLLVGALLWSLSPTASDSPVVPAARATPGVTGTAAPANGATTVSTLTPHQEPRMADDGLSWGTGLRALVSLGVVLGLIVLSARGVKRLALTTGQTAGVGGTVRVVETTYVPAPNGRGRSALHLIEAGERLLLVGATEQQMSLLAEFEDDGGRQLRLKPSRPVQSGSERSAGTFEDMLAAAAEKGPRAQEVRESREARDVPETRETRETGGSRTGEFNDMLRRLRASAQRLEGD